MPRERHRSAARPEPRRRRRRPDPGRDLERGLCRRATASWSGGSRTNSASATSRCARRWPGWPRKAWSSACPARGARVASLTPADAGRGVEPAGGARAVRHPAAQGPLHPRGLRSSCRAIVDRMVKAAEDQRPGAGARDRPGVPRAPVGADRPRPAGRAGRAAAQPHVALLPRGRGLARPRTSCAATRTATSSCSTSSRRETAAAAERAMQHHIGAGGASASRTPADADGGGVGDGRPARLSSSPTPTSPSDEDERVLREAGLTAVRLQARPRTGRDPALCRVRRRRAHRAVGPGHGGGARRRSRRAGSSAGWASATT